MTPLSGTEPVFRAIRQGALRKGLFLRPLGNVVYLFLPQCATADELDDILTRFVDTVRGALR